jgi:SAM-dependent methyltransferase
VASTSQIESSRGALGTSVRTTPARPHGESPCPLCGSRNSTLAFRENRSALRVCLDCDLFFVQPYPTCTQHHEHVSSGSHPEIEILDCVRRYHGERLYYDRHFEWIAQECAGATSLLDVGCGTGHLLERLSGTASLYRAGIELNAEAAAFARRVSGCDIFEVPLECFRSPRRFDVITMINVFSHLPDFDAMFASLHSALHPAGKLILRTSEMTANVSRWNQLHWGIPDDLHFLGFRTLEVICAKYGFAIARHVRTPFEDELFRVSRWKQMGRSHVANLIKRVGVTVPGFLRSARRCYASTLGQRLFVSFVVLKPTASRGDR